MKNTTLFLLINMFSGMGYSIVSPLFPSLGKKGNLSEEILGWIISTYSISSMILTPFIPSLSKRISRINLLSFSTFFEATCTFLYGFLPFIPSYSLLLIIIFSLRIIHGSCSAIIGTLVYSLTISLAEEKELQLSLGNLEIGWSLGTSCGPLFSSIFYRIGGFPLPFIALGSFLYISVYLSKSIDSEKLKKEEDSEETKSFLSFLFYPKIVLISLALIIGMINVTFYYPCLTNHLTYNYNLSVSIASLFFIIPVISYTTMLQFLDFLSSKFGIYSIFSFGLIIAGISPLFIYPCPPIPQSLISISIGFLMIGLGSAPIYAPGIVALSKNIRKIDANIDELSANDISSAINNLTLSIGDFMGPIFGGFFTSRFNFKICCFIAFLLGTSFSIIFIFYFFENIKEEVKDYLSKSKLEIEKKQNGSRTGKESLNIPILNNSILDNNKSFFGKFKFESFSLRIRHSLRNRFQREGREPKISLYSSLSS